MEVTRILAEFVAGTPADAVPEPAREQARRAVLDTLGVTIAGSREEASRIVAALARDQGGREDSSVLGGRFRIPAGEAALVNGTSAHALDYDDVTLNMRGHPSVPLLPALLALGESQGSTGREVIEAFVLGFEVECKLGRAIGGPHYGLGWHATSTLGTVGAAAGCARLLRLDVDRAQAALGIAASLASGLQQNFGTMTKPLHAGWAARNGVVAATLAAAGLNANTRALEGGSGFMRAMSGGAEVDPPAAVRGLGDPWEIVSPGVAVKAYPCCYATHRAIDAILAVRAHFPDIEAISDVEAIVSRGTFIPLIDRLPRTGLEAKFSLEYCLAAALADGYVRINSFADGKVTRPEVLRLAHRLRIREEGPPAQFPIGGVAEITVRTPDGEHAARVETPRGDPQNPLSWDELSAKFRECAGVVLPAERVGALIAMVESLDSVRDIRELTAAVEPEPIAP